MYEPLTVVHGAITGFMAGLIWTVHIVHDPLFALVNEPYRPFQEARMARISALLALPWGLGALTAAVIVSIAPDGPSLVLAIVGAVPLAAIAGTTTLGAAPIQGRLVDRFDDALHLRLLRLLRLLQVHRIRATLWTARLPVAIWLVLLA